MLEARKPLSVATQALVTREFHELLGRAPDAQGMANWSRRLDEGMSVSAVALAIEQSPEFCARQVTEVYQTLIHRDPDPMAQP
jgi:hypothetical protein